MAGSGTVRVGLVNSAVIRARRRLIAVIAAVAVVVLAVAAGGGTVSAANPPGGLAADTIAQLSGPETTLALPADGRINGYAFDGKILGVATGTRLGSGVDQIVAVPGQRLWVFGLALSGNTDENGQPYPVDSTLVVDGSRLPFPAQDSGAGANAEGGLDTGTSWQTGDTYWVASVPADATDVAVELSSDGYTQTFSLAKMAREGPQPTILYENATTWKIDRSLSEEKDIPVVDTSGQESEPVLPVTLSDVSLSWFPPGAGAGTPAQAATAWLVPDLSTVTGSDFCLPNPLPASALTLRLPGRTVPVRATAFPNAGADEGSSSGDGAFTAAYGFQVPATTRTATLVVAPRRFSAAYPGCFDPPNPFTSDHTATFTLTFPVPTAWKPPADATSTPAPTSAYDRTHPATAPSTATASTAPSRGRTASAGQATGGDGGGSSFPIGPVIAAIIAAALIIAAGIIYGRRRRTLAVVPAGDAGPEVPAGVSARAGPIPAPAESPPPGAAPMPALHPPAVPPPAEPHPRQILAPIPEDPYPWPEGVLVILVLGTPAVAGWPDGPALPRPTALEILVFLGLHPSQRFSADQLRTKLGEGREKDLEPATIRRYIGELRPGNEAHLPQARGAGGYELLAATTDAAEFEQLTKRAAGTNDPAEKARLLAASLSLVRGAPFADTPEGTYAWVDSGRRYLRGELSALVVKAATTLADLSIAHHDSALAGWAARQGLLVSPTEEPLYERILLAAAHEGEAELERAWDETQGRLTAAQASASTHLYEFYRRLRQQPEE